MSALETKLLDELAKNPFVLAPMAGITDLPFRSFMREMGCGIVITELVSATGLKFSSERTRRLMQFEEVQRPVGVQLFGEDNVTLAEAAAEVEQMGADFVDLNFGCPVPKVVKKGAGAAMLKDLVVVQKLFRKIKSSLTIPLTVKIRTGWDDQSRNAIELAQVAYDEGLTWVAIHGRTRAQAYRGRADWEYISQVKQESRIPILGNGDLVSSELANLRLQESGCDGVMIGRGCLKDPWIFRAAMRIRKQMINSAATNGSETVIGTSEKKDFLKVFEKLNGHLERSCSEKVAMLQVKKLSAWYSAGYPGSSSFRKELFQMKSKSELHGKIKDFFMKMDAIPQRDTSHEPFLMGGHG